MTNKQTYKSLLRYPGGKTRAIKILKEYIPSNIDSICSPFLGGASFELFLTSKDITVYGYDGFEPLANFWKVLLHCPNIIADSVQRKHPLSKDGFYMMRETCCDTIDDIERAAMFYTLNRSSFSGATMSGGMSPNHPRFTQSSIDRLRRFYNDKLNVGCMDFEESIPKHDNMFLYLDPPYVIESNLYGKNGDMHSSFNHEKLFDLLDKRNGWVLSYNNCDYITDMYDGFNIYYPDWKYGMSKNKDSKEVIIVSEV